jgi:RNA polymerase sigma-70 factor (ECF subfamily)
MTQAQWLAERFEANRGHLRAVAYRMLGSASEAEDAVQESWLHVSRADTGEVKNLSGYLTTIVARVCLDILRSRKSRREEPMGDQAPPVPGAEWTDPEREAVLVDSVGLALLVVLDTLGPAERLAFVLHDMFAVPFEEIAPIVGRSPAAARQLASRARRRVQETDAAPESDVTRKRELVDAFLAAARAGDFEALLEVLDPDVIVRADKAAVDMGTEPQLAGASAVARAYLGRATDARAALVDGAVAAVWMPRGVLRGMLVFHIDGGKIVGIEVCGDRDRLGRADVSVFTE